MLKHSAGPPPFSDLPRSGVWQLWCLAICYLPFALCHSRYYLIRVPVLSRAEGYAYTLAFRFRLALCPLAIYYLLIAICSSHSGYLRLALTFAPRSSLFAFAYFYGLNTAV